MEIKASDVKELREKTGAGMMECKKALQHCNGDAKEAEKYLKEKGLAAVEKRSDRATSEGIIIIKGDEKHVAMVELTCETDFVAKNEDFIAVGNEIANEVSEKNINEVTDSLNAKLLDLATRVRENMTLSRVMSIKAQDDEYIANYIHSDKKTGVVVVLKADKKEAFADEDVKQFAFDCCLHVAAFLPPYIKMEDVDSSYIAEQEEIFKGQVADLDKPEKVKEGIIKGKINKHLSEICFMEQMFVKDDKVSVKAKLQEVGKKAGCKLEFSKVELWQLGVKK
ncbi:MAG: translation elongation factor Ts [Treponema sp.]